MRIILILCILARIIPSYSSIITPVEVRALYEKASKNEQACDYLVSILHPYNENNHTLLAGYKACASMLSAKYALNPYTKINNFKEGRKLLDKVIKKDLQNIELRFLRFAVQTNAPDFLGYNSAIEEDKNILIKNLAQLTDLHLKQLIQNFLLRSTHLSEAQKILIKK